MASGAAAAAADAGAEGGPPDQPNPTLAQMPRVPLWHIAQHLDPMDMHVLAKTCKALNAFFTPYATGQTPALARDYPALARLMPMAIAFDGPDKIVAFVANRTVWSTTLANGETEVIINRGLTRGGDTLAMSGGGTHIVIGGQSPFDPNHREIKVVDMYGAPMVRYLNTDCQENKIAINESGTHFAVAYMDRLRVRRGAGGREKDGTVTIYTTKVNRPPVILPGNGDMVFALAINRDATRVVTVRGDASVQLWDGRAGRLLYVCDMDGEGPVPGPAPDPRLGPGRYDLRGSSSVIALSPDGTQFSTGNHDGVLCLRSTENGRRLFSGNMGFGSIITLAYNRAGTRLAVAFDQPHGLIAVYDTANYARVCSFSPEPLGEHAQEPSSTDLVDRDRFHTTTVDELAFSPDGNLLVSCNYREVLAWHLGRCA